MATGPRLLLQYAPKICVIYGVSFIHKESHLIWTPIWFPMAKLKDQINSRIRPIQILSFSGFSNEPNLK